MRLRNRDIPQAGTGALGNGESRPGPSGSGCPPYSGVGTVSHDDNNIVSHCSRDNSSSRLSPISSLFSSPPSSPASYLIENQLNSSNSSLSPSIVSTIDVVQEATPANVTAPVYSNQCKRKKWSKEMNIFIMHEYFILTKLETDTKSYLSQLHLLFSSKFPEMEASKQRVGDQRRAIVQRNLLSRQEISTIKNNAKTYLQNHQLTNGQNTIQLNNTNNNPSTLQRMRWSTEVNETIMRTYYRITKLESDLTTYRPLLHREITTTFPSIAHLSIQRIADQRRSIVSNHYITSEHLKRIREEVRKELDSSDTENHQQTLDTDDVNLLSSPGNTFTLSDDIVTTGEDSINNLRENSATQSNQLPEKLTAELETELKEMFMETYEIFKDTAPTARPSLPKLKTSKKLRQIVSHLNTHILPNLLDDDIDINKLHTYIYTAAYTTTKFSGLRINTYTNTTNTGKSPATPRWQKRLEHRINDLRASIGRLTEYARGTRSIHLEKQINKIKQQYKIHSQHEAHNSDITHFLDTLKQKLNTLSNRLKRYKGCTLRKTQNKEFNKNEKLFYRKLTQKQGNQPNNNSNNSTPSPEALHTYWSNIWSRPAQHKDSQWIEEDEARLTDLPDMECGQIQIEQLKTVITKTHNWKATGSDNIHNFWLKKLTCTHSLLHKHLNLFIQSPDTIPSFITQGVTYMLPKDNADTTNPAKYRPITCLQTIYKIFTACLTDLIYTHINKHDLLAEEQKGCRKFSQGCKEQLIIDSVISEQALKQKRSIYTMYIDYKKAFDSVPHTWLAYILKLYKINPMITNCLEKIMPKWHTKLKIFNLSKCTETDFIPINRGIFQGDSLSPLWFCLALNPLSYILNKNNHGFKIQYNSHHTTLSHLMYMDDIKLFANTQGGIHALADLTQTFSNDIHMEFGIDKCKIQAVKKGKIQQTQYTLNNNEVIESVDPLDGYKYLGYYQTQRIHHKETKKLLQQKFKERLHKILVTHLNAKNTIKAINAYAIPILTYSFGIVRWNQTELKTLQRVINTTMTKHRKHHPRACIQRLILPNTEGGRGLIDILNLHSRQITLLRSFFYNHAQTKTLHQAICHTDTYTPLMLAETTRNINSYTNQQKIDAWTQKSLHGRHRLDLTNNVVDKIASNAWLKQGELFPETEGFMLAIQDQVIDTKNYRKYIIRRDHNSASDHCRHCHKQPETIQHITGACSSITQTDYKHRHDQVAAIIHQTLALKHNLITDKTPYYKYTPQIILESPHYKLYWDRTILTDKTVHHNRPDITLHDKLHKTVYLIDIAIPNTHNLTTTHSNKLTKYTDLSIEIKSQWKVNTVKTLPIIISTTGIIPKTLHTSLKTLNIHPLTYITLQKAAILNTCRIVRKFLSIND